MTHPFPRAGDEVARVMRDTGGGGWAVTDEDSFAAARWLARLEGLFLQPAAAAPAACLMTGQQADVEQDQVVIGIGTGSGKNQVAAALAELPEAPRIPPDLAALEARSAGDRGGLCTGGPRSETQGQPGGVGIPVITRD